MYSVATSMIGDERICFSMMSARNMNKEKEGLTLEKETQFNMARNDGKITYTEFEKRIKRDIEQKGFFYVDKNILSAIKSSAGKRKFIENLGKLNDLESINIKGIEYCVKKEQYSEQGIYFIYNSDNFEPVPVKSVYDFLEKIYNFESETFNRYFRGEKAYYQLIPSLFRHKEWVENEMELNARVYNDRPRDFADCHSTFDKLVKLKHFVHPSRLLDISTNPLVALFFACDSEEKDKNTAGVVLEAYCKKDKEKFSVSSDTVVMLTAMTNTTLQLKDSDKKDPLDLPCRKKRKLAGPGGNLICPKINGEKHSCYYKCWPEAVRKKKNSNIGKEGWETKNEALVKYSWAYNYSGELSHQCKKESMTIYWDDVCFNELNQCILVKPPLNNDRIVRQQGCFIMCGMNPENIYEPPESLYKFFRYPNDESGADKGKKKAKFYYILPGDDKKTILKQLKVLGMDEYYFFPELENEIKVVKALPGDEDD